MVKKGIPDRWNNYRPMGHRVPGTRFLPFKVPLKESMCTAVKQDKRFTPSILIERAPELKCVIDLTATDRYYNPEEFTSRGVEYVKIYIQGQKVPPLSQVCMFYQAVDQFVEKYAADPDALLGVHCTHGLNRTGYLICKYMVEKMKIDPKEAISKFETARGYPIERKNYTDNVCGVLPGLKESVQSVEASFRKTVYEPPISNYKSWRTQRETSTNHQREAPYRNRRYNFLDMRNRDRNNIRNRDSSPSSDRNWRSSNSRSSSFQHPTSQPNRDYYTSHRDNRNNYRNNSHYQSPLDDCYSDNQERRYSYTSRSSRTGRY